jgi:hemerythrin
MMKWTPDLAVGVDVIDAQHRELFDAINAVLEATAAGREQREVVGLMEFLEEYIAHHFGLEEMYMRRYVYPGYPYHKSEHTGFVNDFFDLREDLDRNGVTPALTGKVTRRVSDWLVDHIGKVDKALGAFLREVRETIRKRREGKE